MKLWGFAVFVVCIVFVACEDENSSAALMKESEKQALYSTVQGFVGRWWNGSDLYPDPCGWTPIQGVSCDIINGFWYVTDISIGPVQENSLACDQTVEFNPKLFALQKLKSLSFFNCFSSPVKLPSQKWELLSEKLQSLEFRSNPGLTGEIPANLGSLKSLKSLVMIGNGLTGGLPENLGYLPNLKRLNLAGNSLTGKIPVTFGELKELLILDISRNSLSGELPPSLGELISLIKLDLSNNQLTGNIPEQIGNLEKLTLLDLSSNRLTGGLAKPIPKLISLQEIILSNNPTGGEITTLKLHDLKSLTAVDLSNMSLTGGIPDTISNLKSLRFLRVSYNNLIGNIPVKIESLPNISAIYVQGNNLTGELKFSAGFYSRLGRRFEAWGNPNLCFPSDTAPAPAGMKRCTENSIMKYATNSHRKDSSASASASASKQHDQAWVADSCVYGFSVSVYVALLIVVVLFLV